MIANCRNRVLALGLAVAAFLVPAGRAAAQGTSGVLPNPISGRDLDAWSATLQLSPEQRQAIDSIHQQYLEQYRQLRENEIEKYLQDLGGMFGGMWNRGRGGGGPGGQGGQGGPGGGGGGRGMGMGLDRATVESSLNNLDKIMASIRSLDDRLFDQAQAVLDDSQATGLPRVRQSRERTRYRAGGTRMVGFVNEAARVDLSAVYARIDLPEAERQATDPLIAQYESRLSAESKALYEATTRVFLRVIDILEKQGFDPGNLFKEGQDPRAMFQAMRDAWGEALTKPREVAAEISELNRGTVRRVGEFLPPEHAALLRERYLRRAYPDVPSSRSSGAMRAFNSMLSQDLPDDLHADVLAGLTDFRNRRDAIVDEMLNAIDEQRNAWTPMGGGPNRRNRDEALDPFRKRLEALDASALEALLGMVGPERALIAKAAAAAAPGDDAGADGTGPGGSGQGADAFADAALPGAGPDPFLPQPLTRNDIRAYRKRLDLAEKDWFILETLHEEYVASFDQVRQNDIEPLLDAMEALRSETEPATPAKVEEAYELRVRALENIRQLDAAFFGDVKSMVAAERQSQVKRMAAARERAVYNRGDGGDFSFGFGPGPGGRGGPQGRSRSHEANVDLEVMVDAMELSDEERGAADKILADYEVGAGEGFRKQYDAALRLRHEMDKMRAERAAQRQPGDDPQQAGRRRFEGFRQLMDNQGRQAEEARKAMADLNHTTMEALASALPQSAQALRDAYNRQSFPQVYDDPRGAGRFLAAALELPELTADQAARLKAINAEFAPADRKLADELAHIYAADAMPAGGDPAQGWRAMAERRNKVEVIEFDRRELSSRALRQLRAALSEEQQTRLRLPPAPTRPEADEDDRPM